MSKKIALAIGQIFAFIVVHLAATSSLGANYTVVDVGPAREGTGAALEDGYEIRSRGREIGGTSDDCKFAYEKRAGNFDIQARLESVTITDPFVHAGLMARGTLDANAPFAAVFSSSALLSAFFESRATSGAQSQPAAPPRGFPANYPQMYLRLKRSGNAFTGFASFDGVGWHQLGTATVSLPNEVFLGLAAASLNTNAMSTARFREIKETASQQAVTPRAVEFLGPSNRRTGLVFSEIMYNPAPRTDGAELEFVEIFNAESVFIDMTGWRIAGGIEFSFPAGFRIDPGQFIVVAADPAAIERVYGVAGALGPFAGRLNNSGDTVKLLNKAGATRLEVKYSPTGAWPIAAGGTGHSLVLKNPSYGEDDPRAWSASEKTGGSPGEVDAQWANPWAGAKLNEVNAGEGSGFIEIYNASNDAIDLSSCLITNNIRKTGYRIPGGTVIPARGFFTVTQAELPFSLRATGSVYLFSPNLDRVLDAVQSGPQESGISFGRTPDGAPRLSRLAAPTQNAPNAARRIEEVVINEIMYKPLSGDEADSYVELHNRSGKEVNLSGWALTEGIEYEIPEGTTIAANGFLVIAKDAAHLAAIYPQLNTNNLRGNFSGNLSGAGERITLAKRELISVMNSPGVVVTNLGYVTISEATYADGGRWPELANGGGSSLELIDARADPRLSASWAASDETSKAPWTTAEITTRVELGSSAYPANRIQVLMLGAGECLIDNIELIPAGSTNIVVNGDFETGTNGWRFFGNHSNSKIGTDAAYEGANGLHLRAPGDGDTGNNAVRGNLIRNLPQSGTATLRAKVRWLAGWPEVLLRVRGNWLELPARMEVPAALGTPGLPNSRSQNAGPAIYDVTHSPALPRANETVLVTCRVSDPDGVAAPQLIYRVDPNQTTSTLLMRDDGIGGDALAGDGVFTASMGGRSSRTLVAYRIEASDDSAQNAASKFPAEAPAKECLIRWDDTVPFGTFAHYHLWSTAATESARSANPDLDNTYRDATLVYGTARVIYNTGFRDKGSPYHSGSGDFAVTVGRDEPLLGIDDRVFASTGNGGDEGTYIKGDMAGWVAEQMGIPFLHSHFMKLFRNGNPYRSMMYDMEQPNRSFAKSWYGGGGVKDDLFKIAIWFEFDDNNSGFNSTGATLQRFVSDGKYKLARYRWNWQIRPSTDTANDYSSIFNLAGAANSTTDRTRLLPLLADMEEWMRVFAYHRVTGNWDSYSYNVGQNMYLYTPLGQRATLMPWDIDFVLGEGEGTTAATLFTAGTDSVIQQLMSLPLYRRMLWRAYQDAINGPLLATNYQPQIDARRAALSKNGVTAASPTSINTYMNGRRTYISGQLQRSDATSFYITTNNGESFTNSASSVVINGVAPFAVASIEVNNIPFPVTWTGITNWQINVPLVSPTNVLEIVGRDLRGQFVNGAIDTITVFFNGTPPQPSDWVVINEIHYHAAAPGAEFVELYNRHSNFAFDLSGFRLEGIDYTFPTGTLIQPNGYLVIVENKAAFAAAFDPSIAVLGPYSGKLQENGETLRLVKPGVTPDLTLLIDEVRYSNSAPWPASADGLGPSLQLIDPAQDNYRAGNWATTGLTDANRATPGRANGVSATLDPFPEVWINEVQPVAGAAKDNFGESDPWIELYNSGASPIDLGGLFLSDNANQLTKWQFPPGTQIAAGNFLLVWADGTVAQSTAAVPHTNFRLPAVSGAVFLSRFQNGTTVVVDYALYQISTSANSFGSYPDGDPHHRRVLTVNTPGTANDATIPNVNITINEWMAASQAIIRDPADGQFQDWFELFNKGTNTVDLSGYYLTDNQNDRTQFQIPAGYRIGPGEYRLVWADGEPQQNASGRDLHVNFSLRADGEEIALFTPDEQLVDAVSFSQQTANLSEGRFPDGANLPSVLFAQASPGNPNPAQFANRPPVIIATANQERNENALLSLQIVASDPDIPAQRLTYSLVNPPAGAKIDAQTGLFTWTPAEAQGPGVYQVSIRVTDDGTPALSAITTFTMGVREINSEPVIEPVTDLTIDEGVPFTYQVQASDPDVPGQTLNYFVENNVPLGVTIDRLSGELRWTPSEDQGPGTYTINVRVTDNGAPALSGRRAMTITVRDINNPPVIEDIPIQSVLEGSLYLLQVRAVDPETPPAKLTYSLVNAPTGMTIDPDTGLISWTPAEADAPRDYNVVVRVSEPGGSPASEKAFLLGARESNTAPVIDPVADVLAKPGDVILITLHATDSDLPAQNLAFKAIGDLPAGASLSPTSGFFSWQVPQDPPLGTNRITVEVTDDLTPALAAQRSFNIIVRAPFRIAINEIMHRPSTPNAEFVELANYSAVTAADLSGWRLEGYNFTFPSGTRLAPGEFLCVARDVTAFRAAYGASGTVFGNATMTIPANGGTLRLVQAGSLSVSEQVIDEVAFSLDPPWPQAAATQGASLQLIDPWQDHRRVLNWTAFATSVTNNTPVEVLPLNASWKYWQSAQFPGNEWMQPAFNDAAWPTGGALLYVEESALGAPKVTPLTLGQLAYYFRTRFNFNGNPNGAQLRLSTYIDDGAVFYLNGAEVFRLGMPAGAVAQATLASRTVGNAASEGPFEIPAANLKTGENVLAVEVHQINTGSSDIVLGASLQATTLRSLSFTPNAPNAVPNTSVNVPSIWINEIVPNNQSGIVDNAGDSDPWLEIYNAGSAPVSLNGWALTDEFRNLTKWTFPGDITLSANGYLVVWLDGETGETSSTHLHAGFRAAAQNGTVALTAPLANGSAVVDYVTYGTPGANQSLALQTDGNPLTRALLASATPGASNRNSATEPPSLTVSLSSNRSIQLSWKSTSGRTYRIESSTAAELPRWTVVTSGTGDGSVRSFSEEIAGQHSKFYRIMLP